MQGAPRAPPAKGPREKISDFFFRKDEKIRDSAVKKHVFQKITFKTVRVFSFWRVFEINATSSISSKFAKMKILDFVNLLKMMDFVKMLKI